MTRSTFVEIDAHSLTHNVQRVRELAPGKQIIAMVKANAYGCGLATVVPVLDGLVEGLGVACLEEALAIRTIGGRTTCILFEGVFEQQEYVAVAAHQFQCVIHQIEQLQWLLACPLPQKIKIWVKVDTGMHRLGLAPERIGEVMDALRHCPWVEEQVVVMTHFANADHRDDPFNTLQLQRFESLFELGVANDQKPLKSLANSAAIMGFSGSHADIVRPGIMLYGASPFAEQTGRDLGLQPVMRFKSMITAIHDYAAGEKIGYGGSWQAQRPSRIAVVAVGYGDGYPRHIAADTPVCVGTERVPIVGRVSMDMLTIDLTDCRHPVAMGDEVELWGEQIPIELIAKSAGTISYELMCQLSSRVYRRYTPWI